jgi:hypothetical protein
MFRSVHKRNVKPYPPFILQINLHNHHNHHHHHHHQTLFPGMTLKSLNTVVLFSNFDYGLLVNGTGRILYHLRLLFCYIFCYFVYMHVIFRLLMPTL